MCRSQALNSSYPHFPLGVHTFVLKVQKVYFSLHRLWRRIYSVSLLPHVTTSAGLDSVVLTAVTLPVGKSKHRGKSRLKSDALEANS